MVYCFFCMKTTTNFSGFIVSVDVVKIQKDFTMKGRTELASWWNLCNNDCFVIFNTSLLMGVSLCTTIACWLCTVMYKASCSCTSGVNIVPFAWLDHHKQLFVIIYDMKYFAKNGSHYMYTLLMVYMFYMISLHDFSMLSILLQQPA